MTKRSKMLVKNIAFAVLILILLLGMGRLTGIRRYEAVWLFVTVSIIIGLALYFGELYKPGELSYAFGIGVGFLLLISTGIVLLIIGGSIYILYDISIFDLYFDMQELRFVWLD